MKKFWQNLLFLLVVFGILSSVRVFGQFEDDPANICRNGAFPRGKNVYQLATITGKKGEKIYFYSDARKDCPNGENCRLKSYLIPNDEIIVSRAMGGFACAWFQPKKGAETVGWIKIDDLEWIETNEKPEQKDWLGEWRFYDNSIVISKSQTPELFDIKGNAYWKGLGDNIHIGELDQSTKPNGNKLTLGEAETGEYACKVWMQLVGKYLIASDNLNCGGANVTFSGVYQRRKKWMAK